MRTATYLTSLVAIVAMLCLTGGVASADPPGANGGGAGTTGGTAGGTASDVRVEYVCVAGMRMERTFVNGSLAAVAAIGEACVASVVAGFESAPTGRIIVIVEGVQSSAPSELAEAQQQPPGVIGQTGPSISQLPATSTAAGTAGPAIGLAVVSTGFALLRRRTAAR